MRITGMTRIMFILADPVAHVVGSDTLNRAYAAAGLDVAVSPLHVRAADLAAVIGAIRRMQNVVGFGCTIPHKMAVAPLLDDLTPEARSVGAVNFVRRDPDGRLTGHNVDGAGFMAGLAAQGVQVAGRRVLLAGAGGVARAIAFSLARAGAAELVIVNRSRDRADDLAAAVAAEGVSTRVRGVSAEACPPPETFDLAINGTALGMQPGDALPFDPSRLTPATVVAEVVMRPEVTALMQAAQARGCRVVGGAAMMAPQADLVARFLSLADRP